jgi:hypothetical protein
MVVVAGVRTGRHSVVTHSLAARRDPWRHALPGQPRQAWANRGGQVGRSLGMLEYCLMERWEYGEVEHLPYGNGAWIGQGNYDVETSPVGNKRVQLMNRLGGDGWEFVTTYFNPAESQTVSVFRRRHTT